MRMPLREWLNQNPPPLLIRAQTPTLLPPVHRPVVAAVGPSFVNPDTATELAINMQSGTPPLPLYARPLDIPIPDSNNEVNPTSSVPPTDDESYRNTNEQASTSHELDAEAILRDTYLSLKTETEEIRIKIEDLRAERTQLLEEIQGYKEDQRQAEAQKEQLVKFMIDEKISEMNRYLVNYTSQIKGKLEEEVLQKAKMFTREFKSRWEEASKKIRACTENMALRLETFKVNTEKPGRSEAVSSEPVAGPSSKLSESTPKDIEGIIEEMKKAASGLRSSVAIVKASMEKKTAEMLQSKQMADLKNANKLLYDLKKALEDFINKERGRKSVGDSTMDQALVSPEAPAAASAATVVDSNPATDPQLNVVQDEELPSTSSGVSSTKGAAEKQRKRRMRTRSMRTEDYEDSDEESVICTGLVSELTGRYWKKPKSK